jgi:predicted nucleotidyltransferase
VFFDYPTRHFQLREICRLVNMGMPSVRSHVRKLERQGFLKKEKRGVYQSYVSTRNELFKVYKRNDMLLRLHDSGLVSYLADKFVPDAVVLFGSASRGEDVEDSDTDLLVVSREKKIELDEFERKMKRKLSLHFEEKASNIPKELLNNIVNGIVVYGYLEVFE